MKKIGFYKFLKNLLFRIEIYKYSCDIAYEEVINLEIPTGKPICYELDKDLNVIKHYYI